MRKARMPLFSICAAFALAVISFSAHAAFDPFKPTGVAVPGAEAVQAKAIPGQSVATVEAVAVAAVDQSASHANMPNHATIAGPSRHADTCRCTVQPAAFVAGSGDAFSFGSSNVTGLHAEREGSIRKSDLML